MYENSTKLGRTGAGGNNHGNRRSSFPPPPSSHRPSVPTGGRMSLRNSDVSGPRNRSNTNANNNSAAATKSKVSPVEENFSLVPGRYPPTFAMIIRLTPDLVDEISPVEADCGSARIRFDSNANTTTGNETCKNIMKNLKLAYPKMIDITVLANMVCILQDVDSQ